jgi:hypothetical protein
MPKRSRTGKPDINQMASNLIDAIAGEPPAEQPESSKNPAAVALGRLGGLKGGKARAAKLTKERLSEIAHQGATARWANSGEAATILTVSTSRKSRERSAKNRTRKHRNSRAR